MKGIGQRIILLVGSLALFVAACADQTSSTPQAPPSGPDLYKWLVAEQVPVRAPLDVDVSKVPPDDPNDPRYAVGVNAPVDALIELSKLAEGLPDHEIDIAHGSLRSDGTRFVWTGVVRATGASALRLHLTDVFLPRNSVLYVYNDRGDVDGPYTARGPRDDGEVWTRALPGDRVTLQLHYTGVDTERVLAATRFAVTDVGVIDDRFLPARFANPTADKSFCSFNATCVENASCGSLPAAVQNAQDAIALMLFASGPYLYACSGGLIADTTGTNTSMFLTANHCVSKGGEANSLQTFFHFQTPCGSTCPVGWDLWNTGDTVGATILATNRSSDYSLLQLNGTPPAGTVALPFNATDIANADGTTLYRISHPAAAPQAFSEHVVDTSYGTCRSWPRGKWIYSGDVYGATEGGSSGSPVLNAAGEVVGQLSGGCGTNINDDCDPASNATVDGALAAYYDDVKGFLDPTPCTDGDGDGYCDTEDCDDANPAINPGAEEVCDDGVDNDCDGATDAADTDCSTGTCDLLDVGALCVDDAECCSNKCKGKPGAKTCK